MRMTDADGSVITAADRERRAKKATGAAVFGTFVEYYDFSVYGYVAATLATVFFPSDDPVIGLLNTLLVFGSAFLVRPLGAIYYGRLGDRVGRRTSLIASITCMGAAAGLTGLLPGYAQIGVWAPVLLIVLRLLQGFSAGGEGGGAATYIREWAAADRRSLYLSFLPTVGALGKALAAGMTALVASQVPGEVMETWGWRVPFLLAVPLGIVVLLLRLRIDDSPEFAATAAKQDLAPRPVLELFRSFRAPLMKAIAIAMVQSVYAFVGTVFVTVYFSNFLGFSKGTASTIVLVAILFAAILIPAAGWLGSRIGPRRILLWSYAAIILLVIPSFMLMNQGSVGLAIAGLALTMVPYALCQAGTYSTLPEFFPVRVRTTGVAFGHSVGAVLGGGLAPYLVTWLIDVSGSTFIPAFVLVLAGAFGMAIALLAVRTTEAGSTHLYR